MTSEAEIYEAARLNRLLAADLFEGLTQEQWRTPSLCAGWTVREVAAHLVPPAGGFKLLGLLGQLVKYRGNLDRMVDEETRKQSLTPTTELVRLLRERADVRLKPPVTGAAGPMTDTAIHLRDAAEPLGLDVSGPPQRWRPALDFLVSKSASHGFIPPERLAGLRLRATDLDWGWGSGAEVTGTAEAIAMTISGRRAYLDRVHGPGSALLAERD